MKRDHQPWEAELRAQIKAQASMLCVREEIELLDGSVISSVDGPSLVVYFGGAAAGISGQCSDQVERALRLGIPVIPVVDPDRPFIEQIPPFLSDINAFKWVDQSVGVDLASLILRELGITESRRQVFVSYRRSDASGMSEQIFDALSKRGFDVFLDRFDVAPGERVQTCIRDALEDVSFVLLIESQEAHNSKWVFWEVQYALKHHMGLLIVTLPSTDYRVAGTDDLPREYVSNADLMSDSSSRTLTEEALERLLRRIEFWHADGLLRRRRNLLSAVVEMSKSTRRKVVELPDWKLLITDIDSPPPFITILGIVPRLPRVDDLWELHVSSKTHMTNMRDPCFKVLVFPSEYLPRDRERLLEWAGAPHGITLVEIQGLSTLLEGPSR